MSLSLCELLSPLSRALTFHVLRFTCMFFSDIHQRVAPEISFDDFIGQLCNWYDGLDGWDDPADWPCPWDLTIDEDSFVSSNARTMYLMVVGP